MRKNTFNAINHIVALNEFKKHHILLSEEDLKNAFKVCNIPSNALFLSEFKKSGLLVKVENRKWTWRINSPIHYKVLQNIYLKYKNKINVYVTTYHAKKKGQQAQRDKEIEEAINLLKNYGFEIFAPSDKLYKKL